MQLDYVCFKLMEVMPCWARIKIRGSIRTFRYRWIFIFIWFSWAFELLNWSRGYLDCMTSSCIVYTWLCDVKCRPLYWVSGSVCLHTTLRAFYFNFEERQSMFMKRRWIVYIFISILSGVSLSTRTTRSEIFDGFRFKYLSLQSREGSSQITAQTD